MSGGRDGAGRSSRRSGGGGGEGGEGGGGEGGEGGGEGGGGASGGCVPEADNHEEQVEAAAAVGPSGVVLGADRDVAHRHLVGVERAEARDARPERMKGELDTTPPE